MPDVRVRWRERLVLAFALAASAPLPAQNQDIVPAERLAARQWYRDAKFGLFIHWGVYSLLGN